MKPVDFEKFREDVKVALEGVAKETWCSYSTYQKLNILLIVLN